ncbi:Uncharacterised protein [Acinetobacter baumannii]|nr:Uncharacterised protein [Acinetobacter baumannii]
MTHIKKDSELIAVGIGEQICLIVVLPFWLAGAGQSHPGLLLVV